LTVAVAVEDLNQDGFADLVTSNDAFYSAIVRLNNGQAQFNVSVNVATSGSRLVVTDVNGDGFRDLLSNEGGYLNMAVGDGTGVLTPGPTFDLNPGNSDFAVGDLDSDGRMDVVSANGNGTQPSGASSGTLTILRSLVGAAHATATYGAGTHGCLAALGVAASGEPRVNTPGFKLLTTNAPPLATGLGLVGTVQDAFGTDYFGLGFVLHVNPFLSTELLAFDFTSDTAGNASASAPIPNSPALSGLQYFAQSIWLVPGCAIQANDLSSSRGLSLTISP
jgi:hypothetical protein